MDTIVPIRMTIGLRVVASVVGVIFIALCFKMTGWDWGPARGDQPKFPPHTIARVFFLVVGVSCLWLAWSAARP